MTTLPNIPTTDILDALSIGDIDPITVKIWLKRVEQETDRIKELADVMAYGEALKYGEKSFERDGFKIDVCEYLSTKYDYTSCNHPELARIYEADKLLAEKRKPIEKVLQTIREPMTVVDEATGEIVEVFPAVKSGKSGIKLTRI